LIERYHPAPNLAATLVRARSGPCFPFLRMTLSLLLVAVMAGCGHKTTFVLPPQGSLAPVDLEVAPEPDDPPMIAEEPTPEVEPPSQPVEPPKPVVRRRPTPTPPKDAPPVQVASSEPAALAIGSLSSGGESTPQSQQQAKDLIAGIMKRLNSLSSKIANQKKNEVRQVRHFLQQAQQALDSGDAEGAKNLATKASLLMDDVEKK
jgi:predicted small lipoprotein YifL